MASPARSEKLEDEVLDRLTEKEFWNSVYLDESANHRIALPKAENTAGLKGYLKTYLGEYWRDYADYLEWNVLYKKYLPSEKGLKIIELGSAPGTNLVRLHQDFGYMPYGVEYSDAGAALNRKVFSQHGIDSHNVIQADVFSAQFLAEHQGMFDLVISRGFIEHFTDFDKVIGSHLTLLKEGGHLIVTIPRLTGLPNLLFRFFNPEVIQLHNLKIMNKPAFKSLFANDVLAEIYCNHYGTFKVSVCGTAHLRGWKLRLMNFLKDSQSILNIMFRLVFGSRGCESHLFSPYLMFIGRKKST